MKKEAKEYYGKKIKGFSDASERIFERVFPSDIEKVKKIHLSGICGTAMGSLAVLLKQSGYEVSGSDTNCYPPMSDLVEELCIDFHEGFSSNHLKGADVVIVGNICGPDNKEAKFARENGIPTLSIAEAINIFLMNSKKSIVISGTHGKTTTTGLLAHVISGTGLDPSYIVGGVMKSEDNAKIGKGEYFVIEGDEYDTAYFDKSPKFLHYNPYFLVVTSVEFDHIDIYKDMNEYFDAFRFLIREVPANGALFIYGDDENVRVLGNESSSKVLYYGLKENNDITARNISVKNNGQEFELIFKGESFGTFLTPLFGKHNLLNTLSVCGVSISIGISANDLKKALQNFGGVKRRQEVIYDKEITIIDDFAHHPTAVVETIAAIRSKYENRRLVIFFEPRSVTSRRKIFENDYGKAFDCVAIVFISTPDLKSVDDLKDFIDPSNIVNTIKKGGGDAYSFKNAEMLLNEAKKHIQKGDVVLIMSNGSFDGIHQKLAGSLAV